MCSLHFQILAVVVLSKIILKRGYFVGGMVPQDEEEEEGKGDGVTYCQRCAKNQKDPKRNNLMQGLSSSSSSNSKGWDKCSGHERYRCFLCGCQCVCGMVECESDRGMKEGRVMGMMGIRRGRDVEKRRNGGVIRLRCWWAGGMCTSNLWQRWILTSIKGGLEVVNKSRVQV